MASRTKSSARTARPKAVRQSVTIPADFATEVRRVARERHVTMSRALVSLAERGMRAEVEAKQNLKCAYDRFFSEREPSRKDEAGKDLIRAIFGTNAIAEDSLL